MQNESWMQPALQSSEAVLLPALERQPTPQPRFGNRYLPPAAQQDSFRPADLPWEEPKPAVQPVSSQRQGSMAGRSVLRAAGVRHTPIARRCRRCR